jgi:hypothetical protein
MHDPTDSTDTVEVLRAVLAGGPADIPAGMRVCDVPAGQEKIKVPWCGGYEHFERDDPAGGHYDPGDAVVYRWTFRTRVAE